jgi:chemotaxis protein methyltransferase WspC
MASLARARSLADLGRIDEALETCRQAEAQLGPSADLFALLGILHQARRENDTATSYFTKALYLDPNHRESLHHLLLLHQHQGAGDRAAVLRARLDRLPPQGDDA